ncbi:MAG TPA: DUF1015 domain-containing protein [bacterium]|nr:DUF1015 domain-containing protein [bacterium]
MPELRPFRGIVYNKEKVDIAKVATQPYDKISPAMQEAYYRLDPHNFVRLILNKTEPTDEPNNNRYTRAVSSFQSWLRDRVMVQDREPALYLYDQTFVSPGGQKKSRRGFVAVMRLEEFSKGGVFPHEKTLSKPKMDRYELLRESNTNFEHIFMLYRDEGMKVNALLQSAPSDLLFEYEDEYRVSHRLSRISHPKTVAEICSLMRDKKLFIADGHHRYEVSLNYRNYLHEKGLINNEHGANFRMATFVDMNDAGLVILPTHRMLKNVAGYSLKRFLADASAYFEVTAVAAEKEHLCAKLLGQMERVAAAGRHAFGLYSEKTMHMLVLKEGVNLREIVAADKSDAVLKLDVSILHLVLLERFLGIGAKNLENEDNISYIRDAAEGVTGVDGGAYQATFFLNPTKIDEVRGVAQAGEKMPQKSTDFYPKMSSGLVVYKF